MKNLEIVKERGDETAKQKDILEKNSGVWGFQLMNRAVG